MFDILCCIKVRQFAACRWVELHYGRGSTVEVVYHIGKIMCYEDDRLNLSLELLPSSYFEGGHHETQGSTKRYYKRKMFDILCCIKVRQFAACRWVELHYGRGSTVEVVYHIGKIMCYEDDRLNLSLELLPPE